MGLDTKGFTPIKLTDEQLAEMRAEVHDRVIDSLYEEFKVHNKEECSPWNYLTQSIDSELDELLDTSQQLHEYFLALDDVNNQIPMHHTIDLLSLSLIHI